MLEDIKKNFERIIALYESEKEKSTVLSSKLEASEKANETYRKQIAELERQIDDLKLAQAFLSTSVSPEGAKEKIDKLIKEINKCISLLEK